MVRQTTQNVKLSTMKCIMTSLLIFLFPIKFIIGTLYFYGLEWISPILLYIEVALLGGGSIYACIHWTEFHLNKISKFFLILYVIYFVFIYYQVIISPQMPRIIMQDVPEENFVLFRDFLIQSLSIFLVLSYQKYIDFTLFAKITVILTFLTFFAYFNKVDFRFYGMLDIMDKKLVEEEHIITSFRVAWYMVMAFFCGYSVKEKWSKFSIINIIIFYLCSLVFIVGLFLTIKRGPIFSFLAVCGLVFYFRYKKKMGLILLLCVCGILIFGSVFYDFLQDNASGLVDRFLAIDEGGGSGRFGSDDSVFGTALRQIKESPIMGSYFRLLRNGIIDKGDYPHNILLELLMTGGLMLSVPFFVFFWKASKRGMKILKNGGIQSLPALCFFYVFLSLMTSSSLLFKMEFWVFLAILCTYNVNKLKLKYE